MAMLRFLCFFQRMQDIPDLGGLRSGRGVDNGGERTSGTFHMSICFLTIGFYSNVLLLFHLPFFYRIFQPSLYGVACAEQESSLFFFPPTETRFVMFQVTPTIFNTQHLTEFMTYIFFRSRCPSIARTPRCSTLTSTELASKGWGRRRRERNSDSHLCLTFVQCTHVTNVSQQSKKFQCIWRIGRRVMRLIV